MMLIRCVCALTMSICSTALGQVTVVPSSAGTVSSSSPGVFQVAITGTGAVSVFASPGDIIEWVRVSSSGDVVLTVGDFNPTLRPSRLDEVTRSSGPGLLSIIDVFVDGDLGMNTSSPGIEVNDVQGRIQIEGDMLAPIIVNGEVFGGGLLNQLIVTGDLRNDVIANDAAIGSIDVAGSIVGTPSDQVNISANDDFFFPETIGTISAESIEHAVIDGRGALNNGRMTQIEARTGDFIGSIFADRLERVFVAQDYSGDLEANFFLTDIFNFAAGIRIGGSLTAGSTLTFPGALPLVSQGMRNPIVINNNNNGSVWAGAVESGTATLGSPEYAQTRADLGPVTSLGNGGKVGEVPFRVHGTDSAVNLTEPITNTVLLTLVESTPNEIMAVPYSTGGGNEYGIQADVRFYGRIDMPNEFFCTSIPPSEKLRFQRRPVTIPPSAWTADHTDCLDPGVVIGNNGSSIHLFRADTNCSVKPTLAYQFLNGYEYRITPNRDSANFPNQDLVFCFLDANPNPPLVADDGLVWRVGNQCPSDINGDGVVDTQDLGVLLGAFGTSASCGVAGDVDGDDLVDTVDLGILLGAFGSTCGGLLATAHGPEGAAIMGGPEEASSPGEELVAILGFASIEAFLEVAQASDPQERAELFAALLVVSEAFESAAE